MERSITSSGLSSSQMARPIGSFLAPGSKPEASFSINETNVTIREYCNLHGFGRSNRAQKNTECRNMRAEFNAEEVWRWRARSNETELSFTQRC